MACASRLLTKANVKNRLAELTEEMKSEGIANAKEMQTKLTEIIRQQLEEEVIVVENTGDFTSTATKVKKTASVKDIISAINTLGKMQGLFTDKVDLNGSVGVVIVDDVESESR